jgi:outer membrane protein TolC
MMDKYKKCLIIFLLIFIYEVKCEEVLTWEDCVKLAKENHPDLISEKEKLNQAKIVKSIVESNILPQVSTNLSGQFLSTQNKVDTYSYSITVKQLLFDGFKTSYNISQAEENINLAKYNIEIVSSQIRFRLRNAFIELLKAQELLKINEEIVNRRKEQLELVKMRYEAGKEHKGALLIAEANLSQAEFEIIQTKRLVNLAQRKLTKELGGKLVNKVKGDFNVKHFEENINFENLALSHPSLKAFMSEKESAKFNLKSIKADYFPQIFANVNLLNGTGTFWSQNNNSFSIGIGLSFPIFEGGRREAEVSKATSFLTELEVEEKSKKDSIILELEDAWVKFQNAIDNVNIQKKFLIAAEERAKIAQVQYSNGLISFDNWTIIEDDLVRSKKSFLDSQANALIAEANWIYAKGGTLDEK